MRRNKNQNRIKKNTLPLPYDATIPPELQYLSDAARERYIEAVCEYADGGPISWRHIRDATAAALETEKSVAIAKGVLL